MTNHIEAFADSREPYATVTNGWTLIDGKPFRPVITSACSKDATLTVFIAQVKQAEREVG
jgi:hypothetical protein